MGLRLPRSLSLPISPPALSWALPPPGPPTPSRHLRLRWCHKFSAILLPSRDLPYDISLGVTLTSYCPHGSMACMCGLGEQWLHHRCCGCGCAVLCGHCLLLWCRVKKDSTPSSRSCACQTCLDELVSANTSPSCSCSPSSHLFGPFSTPILMAAPDLHF